MKKHQRLMRFCRPIMMAGTIAVATLTASADVLINDTNFPDANFRAYVNTLAGAEDGKFTESELAGIREINCTSKNISSLKGIEMFTALTGLYCSLNSLESLDLSANTALTALYCLGNSLESLDLSANTALTELNCSNNALESLDLRANTKLKILYCNKVQLRSLDLRANTALTKLMCENNQLSSLDVSGCTALTILSLDQTKLASLDVSGCTALPRLYCRNNKLTSLDVSGCTALIRLFCSDNSLTSLDMSGCTALEELICDQNNLKSLDLSKNTKLTELNCSDNALTSLDLSGNTALKTLICTDSKRTVSASSKRAGKYYLPIGNDSSNPLYTDGFRIENARDWSNATVVEEDGNKMLAITDATKAVTYTYNTGLSGKDVTFTLIIDTSQSKDFKVDINETNFPDANFRAYVKTLSGGSDGVFTASELAGITEINCSSKNIQDLKGIEWFTALTHLRCWVNKLESLDLSRNTKLVHLACSENALKGLALSSNTALSYLDCSKNNIESLDLSGNTNLKYLHCFNNALESLDLRANTALTELNCSNNALTSLGLRANTALTTLTCTGNERTVMAPYKDRGTGKYYLPIGKDSSNPLNADGFRIENTSEWSNATVEEIGGKKMLAIADATQAVTYTYTTGKGYVTFTLNIDTSQAEGLVFIDEENFPDANFRAYVKTLKGGSDGMFTQTEIGGIKDIKCSSKNISNLKGIERFTALTRLDCYSNQLESLDVSANTKLETLSCDGNKLTSLDLSANQALIRLFCYSNQLERLNLSANIKLETLYCGDNQLTSLDVSGCTALELLDCSKNQLTSLDLSANTALTSLTCSNNERTVSVPYKESVTGKYYLPINDLNRQLNADGFKIENVSGWKNATVKDIDGTQMLDITGATKAVVVTYTYKTGLSGKDVTFMLIIDTSQSKDYKVYINDTNFPDANFRAYVMTLSGGSDGVFTAEELAGITKIACSREDISNLKGIEWFTALTDLNCGYNQLTSLDLSANTALTDLNCGYNQLTSLDMSANTALTRLDCSGNSLESLDVSANTKLETLYCYRNQLTNLELRANTALTKLDCSNNKLESLGVSANTKLETLQCYNNQLTSLDVSGCTVLTRLFCYSNQLTSLNVSGCMAMTELSCRQNQLTSLDLKANTALTELYCYSNPLESLGLSGNTKLRTLYCYENKLESLDLSGNTALTLLNCGYNQLTSLDLSRNTALTRLTCTGNKRDVAVNFKYEKDGKTYYYIDMEADERDGMSGDEFHNKLGEGFCVENVISWTGASVGETPVGAKALILEGQPTSITYIYNTLKAPRSRAVDGNMTVTLNLNYDDVTTAVDNIDADTAVRIYTTAGEIHIKGSEAEARVYDMTGHCIYSGMDRKISVVSGIYIVKVGGITKKLAIK